MKKLLITALVIVALASCASKQLYNWDRYERTSYAYLKKNDEKSVKNLTETYEKIIKKQNKIRQVVPPGIYADYGMLLIQQGRAEDGKKMLNQEIALYPESKVFIDRILITLQ